MRRENAIFLTYVYIFRFLERVGESRANRARGGSLLRRVKGSALNNPVSHWFSAPETVINLTISVFNEESLYFGRFSRVLPMPESDRCLSHTFTQSSLRHGHHPCVFSHAGVYMYLCGCKTQLEIINHINYVRHQY